MSDEFRVKELQKQIDTLNFIMARCTSDSAYREYDKHLRELIEEQNKLKRKS